MSETHDESRLQTICLVTIAAAAVTAGLFLLRDVLVPFVLAVFLATPLTAMLRILLEKSDLCRPVAALMAGHFKPATGGRAEQE